MSAPRETPPSTASAQSLAGKPVINPSLPPDDSGQRGPQAAEELLGLVYNELRRLAAGKMAREAPGQTLQPTALVHEAWLRLQGERGREFENRTHFFAVAAEAMRRILIDRARRRLTQRHGGGYQRVELEDDLLPLADDDEQLVAVDDALERLAAKHPAQARVVKLRYFAGMTNEEISQVMSISVSSVKNYWIFSKAWLFNAIARK
jgi:RNA polymerase sigma factor (TIGR02999 family)